MEKPICYKPYYKTTLLIEFDDGKKRTIEGVDDYGIIDGRALYYIKRGMRSFLPSGIAVLYFGPIENYGENLNL